MKATYGELTYENNPTLIGLGFDPYVEPREIFKDPITDDGTKRSKKGLLLVYRNKGKLECVDQQTWEGESQGLLKTIFKDGQLVKRTTLEEIRERINSTL